MNFLFPAAWGWLGLALPIIALYLIRTRLERRSISTLTNPLFGHIIDQSIHGSWAILSCSPL